MDKDDKPFEDETAVLNNNFACYMFDSIKYELNSVEIDSTKQLGTVTTLKNLLVRSKNQEEIASICGYDGQGGIKKSKNFNVILSLRSLLNFCADYTKPIVNSKHCITLTRSSTDNNAVKLSADNVEFKLKISSIYLKIPHIIPSDSIKLELLKSVNSSRFYPLHFRSWDYYDYPNCGAQTSVNWSVLSTLPKNTPRYVIFALQTNRKNNKTAFKDRFDNCELVDVKVIINRQTYPHESLKLDFAQDNYLEAYNLYLQFHESYLGKSSPKPLVSYETFKNYTVIPIDTSKQKIPEIGSVDVQIQFTTAKPMEAGTVASAILITDNFFEYSPLLSICRKKYE